MTLARLIEQLESALDSYTGTVVLVTHDRYLLDRVSTVLLGLDGSGNATWYADVEQWLDHRRSAAPEPRRERRDRRERRSRSGLTYLEKREYETMEETILKAEAELEAANSLLEDPSIASDAAAAHQAFCEHEAARERVDALYRRWAELEQKASA